MEFDKTTTYGEAEMKDVPLNYSLDKERRYVHLTEIRTSIIPSSAVELNTTSALANYATEAGHMSIDPVIQSAKNRKFTRTLLRVDHF
uniref:Uncharacterized protein n=1 Tax=Timema bartmani TaxID=61472 RepID=A0A7R9HXP9_9NEOP|nr:unnamed protein product [Timema bartmani]